MAKKRCTATIRRWAQKTTSIVRQGANNFLKTRQKLIWELQRITAKAKCRSSCCIDQLIAYYIIRCPEKPESFDHLQGLIFSEV